MLLLITFILAFFSPKAIFASGEFTITQNVSYQVDLKGHAQVSQDISLTNNLSQIYAKEYQVNLSGNNLQNITGGDEIGNVIDHLDQQSQSTAIYLKFSQPAIGKGQTKKFTLNYSINDFALKKGNTWEIQFPVFPISADNQQTSLGLEVPLDFGDLSFASVPVTDTHVLGSRQEIKFNPHQVKDNKILLVFGDHQLFDFKLSYYLDNDSHDTVSTEIPIPPDTDSQTVVLSQIEPPPENIKTDADGNWLAQYSLAPNQNITVSVAGQAKIHPPVKQFSNLDTTSLTSTQPFWPVSEPRISAIAQTLTTPKQIHDYIVRTLNYNFTQIDFATRHGAIFALDHPDQSLCTEFTDLFVTLARSKNIPAREIEGFAYSNNTKVKPLNVNSDVLHAWPEYFDSAQNRWVQIDPTWEKTTNGIDYFSDLDLNHLAFVIHGQSSTIPPPPGSYKLDKSAKSVFVDFATAETKPAFIPPELSFFGNILTIKNKNPYSIHQLVIKSTDSGWTAPLTSLPPLSTLTFNFPQYSFYRSLFPRSSSYHFTVDLLESPMTLSINLSNRQHFLNLSIFIGISIFLLCVGGIILTATFKPNEKIS